jgi:hypothetical protein
MAAGRPKAKKLMFAGRSVSTGATQPHPLSTFLQQDLDELASEYTRIYARTIEDPGTAGDEGEENWANLLREWLPNGYKVVTKGRIIGVTGEASQQIDVLVLKPAYPTRLLRKKLYLASGVAAAFECKMTLKSRHLTKAAVTAATVQQLAGGRDGSPYRELMGSPVCGVLAHGHAWHGAQSKPRGNIERALWAINTGAARPVDLPDLICVANLGCWNLAVITDSHHELDEADRLVESDDALVQTMYLSWVETSGLPAPNPVAAAVTLLLGRLGWEDVNIRPLADYFRFADLTGQGQGRMRAWVLAMFIALRLQHLSRPATLFTEEAGTNGRGCCREDGSRWRSGCWRRRAGPVHNRLVDGRTAADGCGILVGPAAIPRWRGSRLASEREFNQRPRLARGGLPRPSAEFDPWRVRPSFELDPERAVLARELTLRDIEGVAVWHLNDDVIVGDQAIPRKIMFSAGGGPSPWLTMGIETRDNDSAPTCTYLELAADDRTEVRAKHLKMIRVDDWVAQIVAGCANHYVAVIPGSAQGLLIHRPRVTREQVKAVERTQRRRRDPRTDSALLERVAALYQQHPEAPNKVVAAEFGVSERTAARWAQYCSEAGLLPKAAKQGQKRI